MKEKIVFGIFLAFLAAITQVDSTIAGLVLTLAVFIFGGISLMWKEPHIKISALIFMVILAVTNIALHGINFGIDFSGGTRIPIALEEKVDQQTMAQLVQNIKSRISAFGLVEAKVRAVGNERIYVEVASNDPEVIESIRSTLSKQGVFKAYVDGKEALVGTNIFKQSIRPATTLELQGTADWGVSFSVDKEGGEQFARAAYGKAGYPVYLYLDKPTEEIFIISIETINDSLNPGDTLEEAKAAIEEAIKPETKLLILEELTEEEIELLSNKTIIMDKNISREIPAKKVRKIEVIPQYTRNLQGQLILNRLDGIGLLSAPSLSPSITTGVPSNAFTITGAADGITPQEKSIDAAKKVKEVESILKGGAFPVKLSLGSETSVPPTLGSKFLEISVIAIIVALLSISIFIGLRYKQPNIIVMILIISFAELLILTAILGSFTIDLAAMAGIIAAVGTGVDAQIVITDEIKKRKEEGIETAFRIIKTNATVAALTMLPLMFSGLVEVIGFAESAILGAILGYTLTRPAYAALITTKRL